MRASDNRIPSAVKDQVTTTVDRFNGDVIRKPNRFFVVRFRGSYAYLDRKSGNSVSQRGRLTYTGDSKDWDFAIYKYSSGRYDPTVTVLGRGKALALKRGMKALALARCPPARYTFSRG